MVFDPSIIKTKEELAEQPKQLSKKEQKQVDIKKEIELDDVIKTEQAYRKGLVSVRDLIAPSALRATPAYLQLGNKYLRTLFVVAFPRYIKVGWFSPLIGFDSSLDVSMFFYPVETKVILKQLQKKVGNIEQSLEQNTRKVCQETL